MLQQAHDDVMTSAPSALPKGIALLQDPVESGPQQFNSPRPRAVMPCESFRSPGVG